MKRGLTSAKSRRGCELAKTPILGDQYVFIAMAGAAKAIISYRIGKRTGENTRRFVADLRSRVLAHLRFPQTGSKPTRTPLTARSVLIASLA